MREAQLQDKCIKELKRRKIYHINIHGGGFTGKGAPDILACIDGQFIAFELKVKKNTMQSDQVIHKRRIEKNGGKHYTPYTFEQFKEILEDLA